MLLSAQQKQSYRQVNNRKVVVVNKHQQLRVVNRRATIETRVHRHQQKVNLPRQQLIKYLFRNCICSLFCQFDL
ncbi:unnamed protein product [Trichobilharzia regenti]|nr:unnamed protein product [Trichobilharzia regenti]